MLHVVLKKLVQFSTLRQRSNKIHLIIHLPSSFFLQSKKKKIHPRTIVLGVIPNHRSVTHPRSYEAIIFRINFTNRIQSPRTSGSRDNRSRGKGWPHAGTTNAAWSSDASGARKQRPESLTSHPQSPSRVWCLMLQWCFMRRRRKGVCASLGPRASIRSTDPVPPSPTAVAVAACCNHPLLPRSINPASSSSCFAASFRVGCDFFFFVVIWIVFDSFEW